MATKQRKPATSGGTKVDLPGVSAEFHKPDHIVPTVDDLGGAASAVQQYLPSREMTLWLGGLGALAALSVIDWPVAAAIGVGTIVAKRAGGTSSG